MAAPIIITHKIRNQRGGAMLVMLVILVMGITAVFVTSLSSAAIRNQRNQSTAEVLALAREALIGSALSDTKLPGSMPCPDIGGTGINVANDGIADGLSGAACPNYLGRLPWKTLKLSDLRDGSGERLWYALSPNFRPQTSPNHTLNSDTPGTLGVSGNITASDVVAIIFAPGRPLSGQVRTTANENTYSHYLESVVTSPSNFQKLTPNDQAGGVSTYNDQMVFITYADLMPMVEQRIAREAKSCLDEYALSNPKRNYPWPGRISNGDYTSYYNAPYILFGRIPARPNVFSTNPTAQQFINYLNVLQLTLNNFASGTPSTQVRDALYAAADNMKDFADDVGSPISGGTANDAKSAGSRAKDLAYDPTAYSISDVQIKINDTLSGLISGGLISHASVAPNSMPTYWTNCPMLADPANSYQPSQYWDSWKSLLFMQVANNCRTFFGDCNALGGDLAIMGSGNTSGGSGTYRAAVVLSRKIVGGQSRVLSTTTSNFLESANVQTETDTTPNTFLTYKTTDPNFSTVNDMVLCLDGKVNCR